MSGEDLKNIISYFELNSNKVSAKELQEKLQFSSDKIHKWVSDDNLVRLERGQYALSDQIYKRFKINLPQGTLRLDKQTFEFPYLSSRENAEKITRAKIVERASRDNLLIKKITFNGNRYDIEFLPARYIVNDNHLVFDGTRTPDNLIKRARVYEGAGRWELGRYFRNLVESPPKNYHESVTEVIAAVKKRYGDIGRLEKLSEHHRGIYPVKLSSESVPLNIEDIRLDPKTGTYHFGDTIQRLPEKEYRAAFTEISKKLSLNAKKFATMTFKRGLPAIGIGLSVTNIATADDKVDASLEEASMTLGGFGGGLTAALLASPTGPIGMGILGVLGSVGGSMLAGSSYQNLKESRTIDNKLMVADPSNKSYSASNKNDPFRTSNSSSLISTAKAKETQAKITYHETIIRIKKLINKASRTTGSDLNNTVQKIEEQIYNLEDPENLNHHLTNRELQQLSAILESVEQSAHQQIVYSIESFVDDVNTIIDRNYFAFKYQHSSKNQAKTDVSNKRFDAVPVLHTAYNLYSFFNKDEAQRLAAQVISGSRIIQGSNEVRNAFLKEGLSAIVGDAFSIGAGNFLYGLSILLELSGRKANTNQVLIPYLNSISNQISMLHHVVVEGFRLQSIAFGIMNFNTVHGFLKTEASIEGQTESIVLKIEALKDLLNINTAYLEEFSKTLEHHEKYHIMHQINDADWRSAIDHAQNICNSYSKSLSVEQFKMELFELHSALMKVQREGLSRVGQVSFSNIDQSKLALLLTTGSTKVAEYQPKTISDNFRLYTEQNIHLFVKYLSEFSRKAGIKIDWPSLENLYNPAALHDITKSVVNLIQTYRNTFAYLGLPEGIVKEKINIFLQGFESFDGLMRILTNSNLIDRLQEEYIKDIEKFSDYVSEYLEYSVSKHYSQNGLLNLKNQLKKDELTLAGLDISKTNDFFTMQGSGSGEYKGWFEYIWAHYASPWSNAYWNEPSCYYPQNDRPCWVPHADIEKTKSIYREMQQSQAQRVHESLLEYHREAVIQIEEQYCLNNKPKFVKKLKDFLLYDNDTLTEWQVKPYYFTNPLKPLLFSEYHIKYVPQSVLQCIALDCGDLVSTWKLEDNHLAIHLNAEFIFKEQGYQASVKIFNQTIPLFQSNIKLNTLESIHYTWHHGNMPTEDCSLYDPDLRRFSGLKDWQAITDYEQGKAIYDCTNCHKPYRATICMPNTKAVIGLMPNKDAFSKLPVDRIEWISRLKIDTATKDDNAIIEKQLSNKKNQLRKMFMKNLASLLRSGHSVDSDFPQHLRTRLLHAFNSLSVNAIIIKMWLGFVGNSKIENLDLSFSNIYDGNDILRELDQDNGGRLYLDSNLRILSKGVQHTFPKTRETIAKNQNKQYPFTYAKQELIKFINEVIDSEIMPEIIADSKPKNVYELKAFVTEFYPTMHPVHQKKLLAMSPTFKNYMERNKLLIEDSDKNAINRNNEGPKVTIITEKTEDHQKEEATSFFGIPMANAQTVTAPHTNEGTEGTVGTLQISAASKRFNNPIIASLTAFIKPPISSLFAKKKLPPLTRRGIRIKPLPLSGEDIQNFRTVFDTIEEPSAFTQQNDKAVTQGRKSQNQYPEKCGLGQALVISNEVTGDSAVRVEGVFSYAATPGKNLIFVGPNSRATISRFKLDDRLVIPTSNRHDGLPECRDIPDGSILTVENNNIAINTDRSCKDILPQVHVVSRNKPEEYFTTEMEFLKTPFFHSSLFLHGLAFLAAFREEITNILLLKFAKGDQQRYVSWQKGLKELREKNAVKIASDLSEMAARISIAKDLQVTENTTHIAKDFMQALICAKKEPKVYLGLLAKAFDEAAFLLDKAIPYVSISGLTQILTKTYEEYVGSGSKLKATHTLIDNLPLLIPGSRVLLDTLENQEQHLNKISRQMVDLELHDRTTVQTTGLRRRMRYS